MSNERPSLIPLMQLFQPPQQQSVDLPHNQTPARVRVAMEFLNHMTMKTMPKVAITEHEIEHLQEVKLTEEESGALATANNMLSKYFAGKLPYDRRELEDLFLVKRGFGNGATGTVIQCIICRPGPPRKSCILCSGTGNMLTFPCAVGHKDFQEDHEDGVA